MAPCGPDLDPTPDLGTGPDVTEPRVFHRADSVVLGELGEIGDTSSFTPDSSIEPENEPDPEPPSEPPAVARCLSRAYRRSRRPTVDSASDRA